MGAVAVNGDRTLKSGVATRKKTPPWIILSLPCQPPCAAQIAAERSAQTMGDVVSSLCAKMVSTKH